MEDSPTITATHDQPVPTAKENWNRDNFSCHSTDEKDC